MTQQTVIINGHTYIQTLDDSGQQISLVGADPPPAVPVRAILGKAATMIPILKAGTATPLQQQQALALILALLINLSDV